jgi:lipoprotein-releasing system ATP-binding protein
VANLLEIAGVTRRYAGGGDPVLDGADLALADGEAVAVVGPSGSGKSTLLNLAGALDRPDSGRVLVEGTDIAKLDDDAQARFRSRTVGFVFQDHHLLPACSALENVLVPTLVPDPPLPPAEAEARARDQLARVGLAGKEKRRPAELSGGERQRVAVARALIHKPKLLLADEPTGSLDAATAVALAELLAELRQAEGTALLVVTHSADVAARMDRVVALVGGKLVPRGAP